MKIIVVTILQRVGTHLISSTGSFHIGGCDALVLRLQTYFGIYICLPYILLISFHNISLRLLTLSVARMFYHTSVLGDEVNPKMP